MMHFNKLPQDCTVDEIKAFLVQLRDTGQFSSSSINLRVCGLKYYFRHVVKRIDLVVGIPNPRIAKYHTEVLDSAELRQLFQACRDVRQLLIVQLLFDTGMRSRELIRLQRKDFDKANRTIILRKAKGQKLRVNYLARYSHRVAITNQRVSLRSPLPKLVFDTKITSTTPSAY